MKIQCDKRVKIGRIAEMGPVKSFRLQEMQWVKGTEKHEPRSPSSRRHFGHAPSTQMAEGTTGSPARGSAAPPSGGLPTGFIVVAVLLAFAGASSCIA